HRILEEPRIDGGAAGVGLAPEEGTGNVERDARLGRSFRQRAEGDAGLRLVVGHGQLRLPEPEFGRGELGALDDEALGPRCAGNRPAPCWRTHREVEVTGLPDRALRVLPEELEAEVAGPIGGGASGAPEIGRASCRERVEISGAAGSRAKRRSEGTGATVDG